MIYKILFGLNLFLLFGCGPVDIKDGVVPNEYLEKMKKYEGVYVGSFESNNSQLELIFKGNRPQLIYSDKMGHDILDESCHSRIGNLKSLLLNESGEDFLESQATFYFDPGLCHEIKGREFILILKTEKSFNVQILKSTSSYVSCRPNGGCHSNRTYFYLNGNYTRK